MFWNSIITKAREEDNYPMSEVGCSFCPYHKVCTAGNEAAAMYTLESEYNLRPWDHMRIGQD
jgi:hypothetical protein